jgi:hypothetical protein
MKKAVKVVKALADLVKKANEIDLTTGLVYGTPLSREKMEEAKKGNLYRFVYFEGNKEFVEYWKHIDLPHHSTDLFQAPRTSFERVYDSDGKVKEVWCREYGWNRRFRRGYKVTFEPHGRLIGKRERIRE